MHYIFEGLFLVCACVCARACVSVYVPPLCKCIRRTEEDSGALLWDMSVHMNSSPVQEQHTFCIQPSAIS